MLQSIAENNSVSYPHVRDGLRYITYIDVICYETDTEEMAMSVQSDLITALARSRLKFRKLVSNTPSIL